uniref:Uncharacterized protein n=1 Tax=Setaria viridis TaxID=4556 RepID=A0A4U6V1B3_SETVI|nr:hypothetical protein SEVIR_4G144001v2 [Setaria viridis]
MFSFFLVFSLTACFFFLHSFPPGCLSPPACK